MRRLLPALTGIALATAAGGALAQDADEVCTENYTEGSVEACQQAADAHPDDPQAFRHLAVSLTFIGAYNRAIEAQEHVVELAPDDPQAHYDLAVILGFIQEYPKAVEPIEAALELAPDNPAYWSAAELILLNAGHVDRAVDAARRGAELGDRTAMYNYAWHLHDGKGSLEPDPEAGFVWLERAADLGHMGALKQMVEVYLEGGFGQGRNLGRASKGRARATVSRSGSRSPRYSRSGRKKARMSSISRTGSSSAAKCPPAGISLHRTTS